MFLTRLSDRFIIATVDFFADRVESIGEQLKKIIYNAPNVTKDNLKTQAYDVISSLKGVITTLITQNPDKKELIRKAIFSLSRYFAQYWKGNLPYFVFPYNPRTITYKYSVMESLTEFGNNTVVRVGWGTKVIPITITGWVKLDPPPELWDILMYPDYRLSWGWFFLLSLEHWLTNHSTQTLVFILNSRVWVGWYNGFGYTLNANSPFVTDYTLNINVHPLSGVTYFEPHRLVEMFSRLRSTGVMANYSPSDPLNWSVWSPNTGE